MAKGSGSETPSSFAGLLRRHRGGARLTQEALAARSGLSREAISMLERGVRTSPRATTVDLLAQALGLGETERLAFVAAAKRRSAASLAVPPDLGMQLTTFVGRAAELDHVRALLAEPAVRLLTVTGPPGVGKTRLALEAASSLVGHYRDGALVVALAPLRERGLVVPAIRQALGIHETTSETPLETVARHCRARHLLLVLDNFEHLLPAGPELVELLAQCPELQALVTSRAVLRVRGEHDLALPPLPEAEAAQLLVERAAAASGFQPGADSAGEVAAICRRLDGLPLALELAAPWVGLLGVTELARRLEHGLALVVEGPRDLPERQRTMRAALDWSCGLLSPEPCALLRRLSVFAGSAPLDGLERVCQAAGALPGGAERHLRVLADHSLVRMEAAGGVQRVAMLESVREYAREQLMEAGELEATAQAHLEHYAALAARAGRELRTRSQASWMERLRLEHDNVRAAMGWAVEHRQAEWGLRLAGGLWLFWDYGGHRREGLDWLERLLAAGGPVDRCMRAEALRAAGSLAWRLGACELSIGRYREALEILRGLGDRRGVADALRGMGLALGRHGRRGEAIPLLEEAVSMLRELDDRASLAEALRNLGQYVAGPEGRRDEAMYEEALAIQRGLGDELGVALSIGSLGSSALKQGNLELARVRYEEGVAIARRLNAPYALAAAMSNLGDLARKRREWPAAAARYRESLLLFTMIGEQFGVAVLLRKLGGVATTAGDTAAAARLYGAADAASPASAMPDTDEQDIHEQACRALREHLGDTRFEALREAGGLLSTEEAVVEALQMAARLAAVDVTAR